MKVCLACSQRFSSNDWRCPDCGQSPPCHNGYPAFAPRLIEGDGADAAYKYAELYEAEAGHFWFRARNRLLSWALQRYFPNANNFLEIGCGTAFVLAGFQQEFPELILSASDILSHGLTYAASRLPNATLFQMDARCIPFEAEFDVIGAFDVLEHVEEDELVLAEMLRATRPGGGIIVTVPQHPFLWSFLDDFSHHKRRYTRPELLDKVARAGFEIICATSFISLLLPLLLLSRLRWRQAQDKYDAMAEFKINPLLNRSLESVLDIERLLIKRGFSLPAGGSLLVVARRWR